MCWAVHPIFGVCLAVAFVAEPVVDLFDANAGVSGQRFLLCFGRIRPIQVLVVPPGQHLGRLGPGGSRTQQQK